MKENTNKDKKKNGKKTLKLFIIMMVIAGVIGVIISAIDFFSINPISRNVSLWLKAAILCRMIREVPYYVRDRLQSSESLFIREKTTEFLYVQMRQVLEIRFT